MIENINKNISVWRGDTTPPTDYHLWETSDGIIKTKINGEWKQLTSPTDKENVDKSIYEISTALHDENRIHYLLKHNNAPDSNLNLEAVTTSKSGLMTSGDKIKLDTNIYNLGYFNTSGDAEQAASQPEISGNNEIALIQYRYGLKSGLIIQQVGDFRTLQILLLDGGNSARWINFTDSTRTKVRAISQWNKCGITSLGYDKNNHKLNVRFLDDTLPKAGVVLPVVGEEDNKWGLLDKTTYDNAVSLYNRLNNLTLKSITPTSSTISKSYQLVDGTDKVLGETINIPKDSSIKTVEIADTNATIDNDGNIIKGSGDIALSVVYILSDGTYKIVNLSLQDFLEESEFGNGLNVENHKVSIKKSENSENYLKIYEDSISVEGIDSKINASSSFVGNIRSWKGGLENLKMDSSSEFIKGNLIITKDGKTVADTVEAITTILDECAIKGKYLHDGTTNAIIQVEYNGQNYVLTEFCNSVYKVGVNGVVTRPEFKTIAIKSENNTFSVVKESETFDIWSINLYKQQKNDWSTIKTITSHDNNDTIVQKLGGTDKLGKFKTLTEIANYGYPVDGGNGGYIYVNYYNNSTSQFILRYVAYNRLHNSNAINPPSIETIVLKYDSTQKTFQCIDEVKTYSNGIIYLGEFDSFEAMDNKVKKMALFADACPIISCTINASGSNCRGMIVQQFRFKGADGMYVEQIMHRDFYRTADTQTNGGNTSYDDDMSHDGIWWSANFHHRHIPINDQCTDIENVGNQDPSWKGLWQINQPLKNRLDETIRGWHDYNIEKQSYYNLKYIGGPFANWTDANNYLDNIPQNHEPGKFALKVANNVYLLTILYDGLKSIMHLEGGKFNINNGKVSGVDFSQSPSLIYRTYPHFATSWGDWQKNKLEQRLDNLENLLKLA